jgi:hypothetical protein
LGIHLYESGVGLIGEVKGTMGVGEKDRIEDVRERIEGEAKRGIEEGDGGRGSNER